MPFPSPEERPDPGIEPRSFALQADSLPSESSGKLAYKERGHFITAEPEIPYHSDNLNLS